MMDPTTAAWMIGRADPHAERDAQQLADLREARASQPSVLGQAFRRVKSLVTRDEQADACACDAAA